MPRLSCVRCGKQETPSWFQLTVQSELAIELAVRQVESARIAIPLYLPGGQQNAQSDGQIEPAAFLRKIGGSKAHGDAASREFETGIQQRRANSLLALLHDGGREPDDKERRQPFAEAHLDVHERCAQPDLRPAGNAREGQGRLSRRGRSPTLHRLHTCLQLLEPGASAFQHLRLGIEFLAGHDVELAERRAQHSPEIGLQVLLHRMNRWRQAFTQLSRNFINPKRVHCRLPHVAAPKRRTRRTRGSKTVHQNGANPRNLRKLH